MITAPIPDHTVQVLEHSRNVINQVADLNQKIEEQVEVMLTHRIVPHVVALDFFHVVEVSSVPPLEDRLHESKTFYVVSMSLTDGMPLSK